MNVNDLPALNATLNGLAAVLLAAGYIFIRRKNQTAHRNCMITGCFSPPRFWCVIYIITIRGNAFTARPTQNLLSRRHFGREVRLQSAVLDRRPHLVVLSKRDILPPDAPMPPLSAPDALAVLVISSVSRAGLEPLVEALWHHISAEREAEQSRTRQEPYADLE